MDVPSQTQVVALIDAFLIRHDMAPSRLGRDALKESQFVTDVRAGPQPRLSKLATLLAFMRERDEELERSAMGDGSSSGPADAHRLSAGAR